MKKIKLTRTSGFTLIELLVVVSIIGLLSSIVLGAVLTARSRTTQTKLIQEMISIRTAAELYRNNNNAYPTIITQLVPTYLPSTPINPFSPTQFIFGTESIPLLIHCGTDVEVGKFFVYTNVSGIPVPIPKVKTLYILIAQVSTSPCVE